jgi:PIN domain nuclease of toxin-antitoxin system
MIVLDTHVFLWHLVDDKRLNRALRKAIIEEPSSVAVPTIVIWESLVLAAKGRITLRLNEPGARLRSWIEQSGFQEAPLTGEIAVLSRILPFEHDDPADRFIAATAHAHGAMLATSDERLRALDWVALAY